MWVYLDEQDRVCSVNAGNMAGNSGWTEADVKLTVESQLADERGAALYRLVSGELVARTEEERMADWPEEPGPSEQEQMVEAAMILLGEVE